LNRLDRVQNGNFGDCKSLKEGIWELRIDVGPGMLSDDGNPRLDSLWAVLHAMSLQIAVVPIEQHQAGATASTDSEVIDRAERLPTDANHVQVFWSGVDVTLVLGKLLHSAEDNTQDILSVENRSKVTMSWSVAKLIANSLADSVAKYEELNGEVKLPGQYKIL